MTAPHGSMPEGFIGMGGLQDLQRMTEDDVRRRLRAPVQRAVDDARSKFLEGLKRDVFAPLISIFKGATPPGFERVAEAFQDGQLALKNRLDLLSPLLDYGSAYMKEQGGFLQFGNNHGRMRFDQQLGPMRGCELVDGGIRLLDKGLWDIRAQLAFGGNALGLGAGYVKWMVRVYRPDGSLFSEQVGVEDNQNTITSTIVSSVVVPEPEYTVIVEVAWIHGSRLLLGGPSNTRLVVQHISRKTDVGATGAENSDEIEGGIQP
ncbi:hypothetical protein [Corynebacterium pseudopelargi]|uniref:Uncharacterized protein n=1 Tax=Corynebacterium pseudopelargi TaxID=2080757 RepID=A0A3G6ISS5_9CORY|nr:hypothetical protein [Corynebacterium pseudopelargi]AZA08691.1 hypothetical protein CPPEL_02800 [Corynebacterium pseudopelargi]